MSPPQPSCMSDERQTTAATEAKALSQEQRALLAEFDRLQDYLQRAPLPPEHPARRAALDGLDRERQRLRRDWRLREKFRRAEEDPGTVPLPRTTATMGDNMDVRPSAASAPIAAHVTGTTDSDWQDVAHEEGMDEGDSSPPLAAAATGDGSSSALGVSLAHQTVRALAQSQVRVATPLQAVVVALHAALRGAPLSFVATTAAPRGDRPVQPGFAAPVRELARDQFLPGEFWDQTRAPSADRVVLRYRREGVGAMLLRVEQDPAPVPRIRLSLQPESLDRGSDMRWMEFELDQHLNLESFRRALAAQPSVEPVLHYKALAQLLTNLCSTLDLGDTIMDGCGNKDDHNKNDGTGAARTMSESKSSRHPATSTIRCDPPRRVPTTVGQAFPSIPHGIGQFDGDVYPNLGPILDRDRIEVIPGMGPGNLMGPNHPVWDPVGGHPGHRIGPIGGPGTMQPRYDPIGPPFGPTDPNNEDLDALRRQTPRSPVPPGGTGVPNDSLLQPPNNLNTNNVFPPGSGSMYM